MTTEKTEKITDGKKTVAVKKTAPAKKAGARKTSRTTSAAPVRSASHAQTPWPFPTGTKP